MLKKVKTGKRTRIALAAAASTCLAVLLALCACTTPQYDTREFDSLEDLKAELGPGYLFPTALPADFAPNDSSYTGFYYPETSTWEYAIYYSNSVYTDEESRRHLTLGQLAIAEIDVRCYEPVHPLPENADNYDQIHSSRYEIEQHLAMLVNSKPDMLLDIKAVDAIYVAHSGLTQGDTPYQYSYSSTRFMSGDILYEISITYYAHAGKDEKEFLAYGKELAKFVVNGMIG